MSLSANVRNASRIRTALRQPKRLSQFDAQVRLLAGHSRKALVVTIGSLTFDQSEQLIRAAADVGPSASPLLLFMQSGWPRERCRSVVAAHLMRQLISSRIVSRTTLDLDASVLEQLRRRATHEGKSMGQVASEQLALALRIGQKAALEPLHWPSARMGRPKVDLEDRDAVWRTLEGGADDRRGAS